MNDMKNTSSYPAWIDLHLHLDGSLSLKTTRKLAGMQGIPFAYSDDSYRVPCCISVRRCTCVRMSCWRNCITRDFNTQRSVLRRRNPVRTV